MAEGQRALGVSSGARRGIAVRLGVALAAGAAIALALFMLWREGAGIERTEIAVGQTPATLYALPGTEGAPLVVIAHGFAGSRQFMQSFSLTLARAGYAALAYDLMGHGRNPVPMSGDVTSVDGTTRLLVEEANRVIERGLTLPQAGGGLALVGHSMATDVLVRTALTRDDVAAIGAVSMYSEAVTGEVPERLLMVSGEWEPHLRDAALDAMDQVAPGAGEGDTVTSDGVTRRAVVAPMVEHIGVLYSATTLTEVRAWLDATFGRESGGPVAQRGPWVALLLAGIMALAWPLFSALPRSAGRIEPLSWRQLAPALAVPLVATPLALWPVEVAFLPVLVADYLALHLGLYGLLQIGVLWWLGQRPHRGPLWPALALGAYGIAVFGLALDTFGASFLPHAGRWPILAAVALGAVPFMVADMLAVAGGRAPLGQRLAVRAAALGSFAFAVALDFEGLFFLVLIMPIILVFFLIFGTMGGWVGRRAGPLAPGLALGVILAWSIGVSFPLFST